MKRNMKLWVEEQIRADKKNPLPILSFPCTQLLGIKVSELVASSELQAKGMAAVAERTPMSASVSFMDLSVEAECFGATIHLSDNEVPTVTGALITEPEETDALEIPQIGAARSGIYVEAIRRAAEIITDRPILAGAIGPFSLAGRLLDVSEAMILCYDEPEMVHTVLEKVSDFTINYCLAFKEAGANGIVLAEPLAGLLSPNLAAEFSHVYVKKIIDAVQTDDFIVIYHNCGNNIALMKKDIYALGASGYHFGNAVRMADMLTDSPDDVMIMGNVSPSEQFLGGTPESIRTNTLEIMGECCYKQNYIISSGCDIPPKSSWDNIDAFFAAADEFYSAK